MNEHDQPIPDQKLEAYLDGSMSDKEAEAFVESLQTDSKRSTQVALQARIDKSLATLFAPAVAPEEHVQELALRVAGASVAPDRALPRRRTYWIAVLAVAASIAGVALILRLVDNRRLSPHFQPTPLAQLYQETIAHGFEPYYECRDDARFAAVFANRQGTPLHLLPMPAGSRMLGLSYPGGLSRETTAMLCEIDNQPVMVFVDRVESDQTSAGLRDGESPEVHVFRTVRQGLVFYEVSPFERARATEFLVVADASAEETD